MQYFFSFNHGKNSVKGDSAHNNAKSDYCKRPRHFSRNEKYGDGVEYGLYCQKKRRFNLIYYLTALRVEYICKSVLEYAENQYPEKNLSRKRHILIEEHKRQTDNKAYDVAEIHSVVGISSFVAEYNYLCGKGNARQKSQYVADHS